MVYGQQGIVEHQSGIYITDIYRAGAPLEGGQKLSTLTPAQLDTMIAATQQTLADIKSPRRPQPRSRRALQRRKNQVVIHLQHRPSGVEC